MKALLLTILSVAVISVFIACHSEKPHTTEIVMLRDITDPSTEKPSIDALVTLFDLKKYPLNGAKFRFGNLSDVSYNRTSEARIAPQDKWTSNEMERAREIEKFKKEVENSISTSKDSANRNNSSLYLPIARELNLLSKSKTERKILVIFSDLMENTPGLSFYRVGDFQLLKTNPDSLKNYFESKLAINPLGGIEIYFIYQPKEMVSDERFQSISEFYRKLLESKGATVSISANLNF